MKPFAFFITRKNKFFFARLCPRLAKASLAQQFCSLLIYIEKPVLFYGYAMYIILLEDFDLA